MKKNHLITSLLLISLMGLSGCSYFHGMSFTQPSTDYLKNKNEPPLKIPAGLSNAKMSKTYGIPNARPGSAKVSIVPPDLR